MSEPKNVMIEFLCKRCGLLTPGWVELSEEIKDDERITFNVRCLHCDLTCFRVLTAGDARAGKGERQG